MSLRLWVFFLCGSFVSCEWNGNGAQSDKADILSRAEKHDLQGKADSVVFLLTPLIFENDPHVDWYHRLIYCRSLGAVGDTNRADSLYRVYISRANTIREKESLSMDYIMMLGTHGQFTGMKNYSDTLLQCCSDSLNKYVDFRFMCYFLSSNHDEDCLAMRAYYDSLVSGIPHVQQRLVSDTAIQEYAQILKKKCPDWRESSPR